MNLHFCLFTIKAKPSVAIFTDTGKNFLSLKNAISCRVSCLVVIAKRTLSFIAKNLRYPTIAQENGIQGKVFVRFVVSATGDVKDVKVMRSLDPYCDKEAIRVIQSLPKWIPGKQNGRNVPVYYTVPITFKLQ